MEELPSEYYRKQVKSSQTCTSFLSVLMEFKKEQSEGLVISDGTVYLETKFVQHDWIVS